MAGLPGTSRATSCGQPIKGQSLPGGSNNTHRLVRRGVPYGPTHDPSAPYDGVERGLLGYFINSTIENQYEFVLREWVNDYQFAGACLTPSRRTSSLAAEICRNFTSPRRALECLNRFNRVASAMSAPCPFRARKRTQVGLTETSWTRTT
jgi:hypothetical protein